MGCFLHWNILGPLYHQRKYSTRNIKYHEVVKSDIGNWSAKTFKPLIVEVTDTDHLFTIYCSSGKPWRSWSQFTPWQWKIIQELAWARWKRPQGINQVPKLPRSQSVGRTQVQPIEVSTQPTGPKSKYNCDWLVSMVLIYMVQLRVKNN